MPISVQPAGISFVGRKNYNSWLEIPGVGTRL